MDSVADYVRELESDATLEPISQLSLSIDNVLDQALRMNQGAMIGVSKVKVRIEVSTYLKEPPVIPIGLTDEFWLDVALEKC